jgi:hypothetical protein
MLEVSLRDTLDATIVEGEFDAFISNLNIAAASGKQFVVAVEVRDDGTEPVAFETRNITRVRPVSVEDAFVGR